MEKEIHFGFNFRTIQNTHTKAQTMFRSCRTFEQTDDGKVVFRTDAFLGIPWNILSGPVDQDNDVRKAKQSMDEKNSIFHVVC